MPRAGVSLGQALDFFNREAKTALPQGYWCGLRRAVAPVFPEKAAHSSWLFLFGAITIFLVLAASSRAFRDPLVILLGSVPMTLVGALAFLFLGRPRSTLHRGRFHHPRGLISKHGILIVQFANQLQLEGYTSATPSNMPPACGSVPFS